MGLNQFGDKVYIEDRKKEGFVVVLDQIGEEVFYINRLSEIKSINGSFVWPWDEDK